MIYSDTGFEHMKDADDETVFVVETFEGSIFQQLYREGCRIVASPVVLKAALNNEVRQIRNGFHVAVEWIIIRHLFKRQCLNSFNGLPSIHEGFCLGSA